MRGGTHPVVLVTGGSGSLGTALALRLVDDGYRVRTLSRSEANRQKLKQALRTEPYKSSISVMAGDICDPERVKLALRGVDIVIHAAALKRIDYCEYDPVETVRVNVDGTRNVIEACISAGIRRAILISTDKACSPSTLYGATKLCAERMWLSANAYSGGAQPYFMALRYGNVFGSAGSVLHAFREQEQFKTLVLTDREATRFHITLKQAVGLVRDVMETGSPGELHIPKLPSYRLWDLAMAYMTERPGPWQQAEVQGLRPAEKMHELLISGDESESVVGAVDGSYVLEPSRIASPGKRFTYSSENAHRMTEDELRGLVREYA